MLGLLAGCGKDYLEVEPRDRVTSEIFYKTQTDAIQATNAAYAELVRYGMFNYSLWGIGDVMSDNSLLGGGGGSDGIEFQQLDNYNIPATNPLTTAHWRSCYLGIGRANLVLANVPAITMDEAIKKRSLGEAQFLRALYYFYLVRGYGDVPLITTPPATASAVNNLTRTPAAQIYEQIVTDLQEAANNLPAGPYTGDDIGRATKWAAKGLLAKVYLTQGNLPSAASQALEVIQQSGKLLNPNYADNFNVARENGPESLFEVQFRASPQEYYDQNGPGFIGNGFFGARGLNTVNTGGYGFNVPEKEFVDGYELNDQRRKVTIWEPGDVYPGTTIVQPQNLPGSPFGYNVRKWFTGKLTPLQYDSPLNIPVLRMGEIYLIYAEAAGPTLGLPYLNRVRRRAFGLPIETPSARDLATTDATAFKAAVLRERRYELAFENDRWYDLKRTGTLVTTMRAQGKNVQDFNNLLPIPQSERDVNPNLTQNQGY
ncbi:RagB/SusD family nutrient uptake outer membrane protein [Hymenobacter tibetensis]|uniref:RagB/SusD family nutrient uptake outer membrane protein n=1 Tax=Hymenobacter tibetensis TaxID=497967 RepID=A0ABY4CYR3_9BACT|nr:RagB/SusD family nutrient uptake outer membrane protein [Hymenobacter tibetensis]UOG75411.1 RagB/SusD family nutrient uptake outer membrane protein [Hymenobacter tibetensis]